MMCNKSLFVVLFSLLVPCSAVLADDQDLQATLEKMQALLEQQQKQLDEQGKELAAQRLLIRQLQGKDTREVQETSDTQEVQGTSGTPDVVYLNPDKAGAIAQDQSSAPLPEADQSGQQQAVLALAQQQVDDKQEAESREQNDEEIATKAFYDPSNTIYDPNFPGVAAA